MTHTVKDFIYHAENAVPKEVCDVWISEIEKNINFVQDASKEESKSAFREDTQLYCPPNCVDIYKHVKNVVIENLGNYFDSVSILKTSDVLFFNVMKAQKTSAGKVGFSNFHIEQGGGIHAARAVTWMIYLNDVEEGGSTEFPYQRQVFQPKAGSLLLWPAGYTHPHRGNPVYSNDKYIVTGWFEFPMFPYDNSLGG